MTTNVNTILFDLGNVLIEWDHTNLVNSLTPPSLKGSQQIRELLLSWNKEYDHSTLAEHLQFKVEQYPEYKNIFEDYRSRWIEALGRPIDGTVKTMRLLKALNFRLFAASNWASDTFKIARPRMTFYELFDGAQISGYVGITKPNREFFQKMADDFGFSFEQAIFIDDREENVAAARDYGITSIHFTGPKQLILELEALNVLDKSLLALKSSDKLVNG